jgi:hypothetical protein
VAACTQREHNVVRDEGQETRAWSTPFYTEGVGPAGNYTAEASGIGLFDGEKEFAHFEFNRIIIWVGWVPVVIVPEVALVARAKGTASVGVEVGVNQAAVITGALFLTLETSPQTVPSHPRETCAKTY